MLDADLVKKTPLLVHLVFHPESTSARALAKHIHVALNVDPVVQGLRIPTLFCRENNAHLPPADQQLDQAEHSFVVPLADTDMNLAEEWCEFIATVLEKQRPSVAV